MAETTNDRPATGTANARDNAGGAPDTSAPVVARASALVTCFLVVGITAVLRGFQTESLPAFALAVLAAVFAIGFFAARDRIARSGARVDVLGAGTGGLVLLITGLAIVDQGLGSSAVYLFTLALLYLLTGFPRHWARSISGFVAAGYGLVALYSLFSPATAGSALPTMVSQLLLLGAGVAIANRGSSRHADASSQDSGAPGDNRIQVIDTHDSLTGCLNQQSFVTEIARESSRARRYNETFALIMIDVDDFKQLNSDHGFLAGDQVLERIGSTLRQIARQADHVGRVGGDELAVLAPRTNAHDASLFANRILEQIQNYIPPLGVTLSMGICESANGELDGTTLYWRANNAMDYAKTFEGNKYVVWDESLVEYSGVARA